MIKKKILLWQSQSFCTASKRSLTSILEYIIGGGQRVLMERNFFFFGGSKLACSWRDLVELYVLRMVICSHGGTLASARFPSFPALAIGYYFHDV